MTRLHKIVVLLMATCLLAHPALAHKYKYRQLYSFCAQSNCPDGAMPYAGLAMDSAGNLYGTTTSKGGSGQNSAGTVFELLRHGRKWREKTLYSFCSQASCADGANPGSSLIVDTSGNLYGTTLEGGAHNSGVAFRLTPTGRRWKYTDLYDFCSVGTDRCEDGWQPSGDLTYDGADSGALYDGNSPLYGTTRFGGPADGLGAGVVFKLVPGRNRAKENVVYAFCQQASCADGQGPAGGLMMSGGILYGTTLYGGNETSLTLGDGVVFQTTVKGGEAVLYTFCAAGAPCPDGSQSAAPLVKDAGGNLVGTTTAGGANDAGTIFQIGGGSENVLHDFCSAPNCADGSYPTAGLIMDASGNLYGVASGQGGNSAAVFERDSANEHDIYEFCCGDLVYGALVRDASGNLFGVTFNSGDFSNGGVFELEY